MVWFILFACVVFGLWFWREHKVQQQDLQSPSAPHRTGERFIGHVLTLEDGMPEGAGHAKLGNRRWRLRGPQVPAGARVRITGVDGTILIVDRLPR